MQGPNILEIRCCLQDPLCQLSMPMVYIGQTGCRLCQRLSEHKRPLSWCLLL